MVLTSSCRFDGLLNTRTDRYAVRVTKEHAMQQRRLGTSGLNVSALGFGCMGISFGYPRTLNALRTIDEVVPA